MFLKRLLSIALLFIAVLLATIFYFSNAMKKQVYSYMKNTLELYNEQVTESFNNTMLYLSQNCTENTDIISLHTAHTDSELYLHTMRIKNLLSSSSQPYSYVSGRFIYSIAHDIFLWMPNSALANQNMENLKCQELLSSLIRNHIAHPDQTQLPSEKWFIFPQDSEHFLVRIIKVKNVYTGAWANLEQISSMFEYFQELDSVVLYVSEDGEILNYTDSSWSVLQPQESLTQPAYYRDGNGQKYITISQELDYCDYYLTVLISNKSILQYLMPPYALIFFILIWLILCPASNYSSHLPQPYGRLLSTHPFPCLS